MPANLLEDQEVKTINPELERLCYDPGEEENAKTLHVWVRQVETLSAGREGCPAQFPMQQALKADSGRTYRPCRSQSGNNAKVSRRGRRPGMRIVEGADVP